MRSFYVLNLLIRLFRSSNFSISAFRLLAFRLSVFFPANIARMKRRCGVRCENFYCTRWSGCFSRMARRFSSARAPVCSNCWTSIFDLPHELARSTSRSGDRIRQFAVSFFPAHSIFAHGFCAALRARRPGCRGEWAIIVASVCARPRLYGVRAHGCDAFQPPH